MRHYTGIFLWIFIFLSCLTLSSSFLESLLLEDGQIFDFIVVGGGTGGCVVAARLADSGKYSVLLIQEGAVPNENLEIPAIGGSNRPNFPNEIKYYNTVPQRHAALVSNGIITYTIGKAIGGASSVNGQFWNRGHPRDYDNWAKILNDSSWNYENMLPFFRKSENYRGINPTDQRGYGGPISIENRNDGKFGVAEFLEASQELGYPFGDPNGPETISATLTDISQGRGRRVSAFSGYIGPLLRHGLATIGQGQNNLVILLKTEVKRIIFEGNRAVGVTYVNHNSSLQGFAKARKEVILTAGAMDSPAILMRSGIGPKAVLDGANIPVVKYVEGVGSNFHDHIVYRYHLIYGNRSAALIPSRDLNPETWEEYQNSGTGPYSILSGTGCQGFFLSSLQPPSSHENGWPDLQIMTSNAESPLKETLETETSVAWGLAITRTKSRGTVTLDNDIENPPKVDPNLFDHPDDMTAMMDLVKLANKFCEETSAMQRIGCRLPTTLPAACRQHKLRSDSYYQCLISQLSRIGYHAGGSCKMGRRDDPESVVDSKLKLIGIQNMRIADASVMPVITNANTQAAVYAIAERAADMILNEWDNKLHLNVNDKQAWLKI